MQSAPPIDRLINDRYIDDADNCQHGSGTSAGWSTAHIATQHQIADVDKPEDQSCRQAGIPGPPGTPDGPTPDRTGDQRQCDEKGPKLGRSTSCPVPTFILLHKIANTRNGNYHKIQHT